MSNQEHIIDALKNVLADSYSLYLKTQNYHWNVEGPFFKPLHDMFEEQYNDLALAIDDIAELIRGLGDKAPGTFKAFQNITSIKDGNESLLANQMLEELVADQDVMIKTLEAALHAAQKADDEVIIGAVIDRMTVHRKNKWMLKSSL
ncbi:MAG: DNA starvation/stationary phase protection protein [Rickettsiales bacterium]|nr:DNA starvation/stationary phase protection protein [Rickettsiales bacterium]